MPDLPQATVDDVASRLQTFLSGRGKYAPPKFLCAGGSAAVFKVEGEEGTRAFKVFDPALISSAENSPDKRRLDLQRRLIGHDCPFLVQTYNVEIALDTAFIEMEFVEWPQLKSCLKSIPDEKITLLINQLVDAVKYLEARGIVHRDIKPENIHISDDFHSLKLLDLGVAREFELESDATGTDQNNTRPFLATAQYSSPEYLFRLDEPSKKLWQGLNFYQVGAVLHDMIMKAPIFQHEIDMKNRWLVARAVLTKTPTFDDAQPARLAQHKALAARCLTKDLDTRLKTVSWDDFLLENTESPLKLLRKVVVQTKYHAGAEARETSRARLEFDRSEFFTRIAERVRAELIEACGPELPTKCKMPSSIATDHVDFIFSVTPEATIECSLKISWQQEIYERCAEFLLKARISLNDLPTQESETTVKSICACTIGESESEAITNIANAIARIVSNGIEIISTAQPVTDLHELDLQKQQGIVE